MIPLVIIPARGGSKGIPEKNIKLLAGKPLINYTIEAARSCFSDDRILVSTDSLHIKEVVEASGLKVPFIRPLELAGDQVGMYEVLLHALNFSIHNGSVPDILVLLQPTSPLRTATHIKEALQIYDPNYDMVVSVRETPSNPYYVLFEEDENGYLKKSKKGNFNTRQECPKVWEYNGAIYIINVASLIEQPMTNFNRIKKYVMDPVSSVDIDSSLDWEWCEFLLNRKF